MFVWVGKEADDVIVIGRVLSAELRLHWPIVSILAELLCIDRVFCSYDSDRFCNI